MDLPSMRYLPNCSLLFAELPLLERPAAAKAAGFDAVEFWWPFAEPVPGDADVDAFVTSITGADVALVGLNFFGGDLAGPDAGVLSIPARSGEWRDNVAVAASIAERLDVRGLNALYGNRVADATPTQQDELAVENLVFAAQAVAAAGSTVLIEPLSGPKPYPLRTTADAMGVVDKVRAAGVTNVGLLFDMFHLAGNGDDLDAAITGHFDSIAHVQIADVPGRGEPGSGELDLVSRLHTLHDKGYDGSVSLEYKPSTGDTTASLGWLPRALRGAAWSPVNPRHPGASRS